ATALQSDLQDAGTSVPFISTLLLRFDGDDPQICMAEIMSNVRGAEPPDYVAGFQCRSLFLAVGQNVLELRAGQADDDAIMMGVLRFKRLRGNLDVVSARVLVLKQHRIVRR